MYNGIIGGGLEIAADTVWETLFGTSYSHFNSVNVNNSDNGSTLYLYSVSDDVFAVNVRFDTAFENFLNIGTVVRQTKICIYGLFACFVKDYSADISGISLDGVIHTISPLNDRVLLV